MGRLEWANQTMSESLISVVVPVYNVENFLYECIKSIINQTFRNLEIILIDDGSTDKSGSICDELQKQDSRIMVIHKRNEGLSSARNTGNNIAKGKYIIFIDSDDIVSVYLIEKLYNAIVLKNADISVCRFKTFTQINELNRNKQNNNTLVKGINGKAFTNDLFQGHYTNIGLVTWNKLYKRSLFFNNNIEFPVGRLHEDTYTTYKLLYYSKVVAIVSEDLYYYRKRPGSIINSKITYRRCVDAHESDLSSVEFFCEKDEKELLSSALNVFFRSSIISYKMSTNDTQCKEYIKKIYNTTWQKNKKNIKVKIYKRFIYNMFRLFPDVICKIY